jgi:hypothetical protein
VSEPRRFELAEAQALLEERVRAMVERMVEQRAGSRELERRWNALVVTIGSNGGDLGRDEVAALRERLTEVHDELRGILAELNELGIEVKDVDRGLIDFPTRIDGRDALFCWMAGEERIAFWHTPEDGFAGRKPL